MTFVDQKGRRNRIWLKDETWIDDDQQFMDDLVALIVKIISQNRLIFTLILRIYQKL